MQCMDGEKVLYLLLCKPSSIFVVLRSMCSYARRDGRERRNGEVDAEA